MDLLEGSQLLASLVGGYMIHDTNPLLFFFRGLPIWKLRRFEGSLPVLDQPGLYLSVVDNMILIIVV